MFLGFNLGSNNFRNAFPPGLSKSQKIVDKFVRHSGKLMTRR